MSSDDEWRPSCYDCGREMAYRNLQPTPVHIDHEDGIGYDRVDVPMCHACRLKRFPTHECPECGEEWLDISDAAECCQHRRGRPMPDGGREDLSVVVYQCPAPGCPFASGGIMEMQDHINETHRGEWNEDDWPDPESDRDE